MKLCERGQKCSCWFDGWWGSACEEHDNDYKYKRLYSKLIYDLKLWYNVTISNKVLFPLGFIMGFVMFLGLTISPIAYINWKKYKKEK